MRNEVLHKNPEEEQYPTYSKWCKTESLTVDLLKMNIMVYTRKYIPKPVQKLKLKRKKITFTSTVKYLVVLLDPKVHWKQHLTEQRKKVYSSLWVCRRTMGET